MTDNRKGCRSVRAAIKKAISRGEVGHEWRGHMQPKLRTIHQRNEFFIFCANPDSHRDFWRMRTCTDHPLKHVRRAHQLHDMRITAYE
jgi:hypothetical protein